MKLRPASGPDLAPTSGSFSVWGTSAPTGSLLGTAIMLLSLAISARKAI